MPSPLSPPHLELWEDGRRISAEYRAGNFDWWYFDAQLADGSTLVFVFMIDSDYRRNAYAYRVVAELKRPDGTHVAGGYKTYDDVEIVGDRPELRIGRSFVRGDVDNYRVVVDEGDLGGLGLAVALRRTCPSRVSPANRDNILQSDDVFGWVSTVPRGVLTGTLTVAGRRQAVAGTVYHDKNWGTTSMARTMHHWLWFRAAVGPYTAVFFSQYPTMPYPVGEDGLQQLFIASDQQVLVNLEGPGVAPMTAPVAPNPDPRNTSAYWAPRVTIAADQDGRRITLEAETGLFVSSLDLAKQTMFLTLEDIERANAMENRPWYSRFVAEPVTLTVDSGSGAQTHTGEGVIEFMDLHLHG
jgi:hypothetical protein